MIDPRTVMIATPSLDGRVEAGYAGGLSSCASEHLFGTNTFFIQNSHIGLVRDQIAHAFKRNKFFDWLVLIDADIAFSASDFKILMDYPQNRSTQAPLIEENPPGTTLLDGKALIVCAEYARKVDTLEPATFGLGFTRIHRRVFEILDDATDSEKVPLCGSFTYKGDVIVEYFPSGTGANGGWFSEDHGFFHICRLAGIQPRIEQRTKLVHIGRKAYAYVPPKREGHVSILK
jgi:hypothetical protein